MSLGTGCANLPQFEVDTTFAKANGIRYVDASLVTGLREGESGDVRRVDPRTQRDKSH